MNMIKDTDHEPIYLGRGKYFVYIKKIDKDYDPEEFGYMEESTGSYRTVEWVLYKRCNGDELHKILDVKKPSSYLREIKNIKQSRYNVNNVRMNAMMSIRTNIMNYFFNVCSHVLNVISYVLYLIVLYFSLH